MDNLLAGIMTICVMGGFFGVFWLAYHIDNNWKEKWKEAFKPQISADLYNMLWSQRKYIGILENKDKYLEKFKGSKDYFALSELYKNMSECYGEFLRSILEQPLRLTKPVSPYTAAYAGTMVGGVAVGMVAANDAVKKEMAYEKNVKDVIASNLRVGNAYDKAEYCLASIESIISTNVETKNDWDRKKDDLLDEMRTELSKKYHLGK